MRWEPVSIQFSPIHYHPSPMKDLISQRDPWGHGLGLWVLVLLIFAGPLAVSSLWGLRLQNDVDSWLPDSDAEAHVYHWCRNQFPEREQVLMTWEGSTVHDPRLPLLVGRLQGKIDEDGIRRGGIPYVENVVHGETLLRRMVSLGIEKDEAIRRLQGNLIGVGWLKVRLTESGRQEKDRTIRDIQQYVETTYGVKSDVCDSAHIWQPTVANESLFDEAIEKHADFSVVNAKGETEIVIEEVQVLEIPPHDFQLHWDGMAAQPGEIKLISQGLLNFRGFATSDEPEGRKLVEECFQSPGAPLGVMLTLSSAGMADKPAALAAIREAAEHSFIPADSLWMGGSVVAETELNSEVLRAAWNSEAGWNEWHRKSVIGLSGVVGIIFALVSLRSFRLGSLVIFVSYYAALLGLSLIPLSGGSMNMVLVVLPTLLMVLALSGAIHVANYWKHSVWENPATAVKNATEMAWTPCVMAAFTTSIGLISLCTSELAPVRAFGLYAAIGSIISVIMVLYGLPALLQMLPHRRVRTEADPTWWKGFGAFICSHWRMVMTTCIATSVLCTAGLYWFETETKVVAYFQPESKLVRDYQRIEDALTGITPIEVVVSFNRESQTQYGFLERMEIVRDVEENIRKHAEIRGSLSLASFQPVRLPPGEDSNARERIFYNRRSSETERRIKDGEIASTSDYLTMVPGDTVETETENWAESGAELWRVTAQASALGSNTQEQLIEDLDSSVKEVIRYYPGTRHVITGAIPLFNRTQKAVLESLIVSFALAFALIAIVMMVVLRDPVAGALSMVPNLLPVVSIFGLVSWCGLRIDVGTMVTASVALGIAVDGTLHLITWFRDGLMKGGSRERSVILALGHCGPAMFQTSAAVGIGLLILLPADLLLISRFGWLMAALIGAALLGDLFLLPALLVGPLGKLIQNRIGPRPKPDNDPVHEDQQAIIPAPHISLPAVRNPAAARETPRDRNVG